MNARIQTLRPVVARLAAALLLTTLLLALAPGSALAEGVVFVGDVYGNPPPATLGPYPMTATPANPLQESTMVTDAPAPTGTIAFNLPATLYRMGSGWASVSHGYTGDVYYFGGAREASLTLPANTRAFYVYIEGNTYSTQEVYAIVDGVTYTLPGGGKDGPVYFGFYSLGAPITTITVGTDALSTGVAVSEFGIYTGPAIGSAPVTSPRADVAAVIYGSWSGIPVQAWVGGTAQPTLYTAPNHEGHAAALHTFWPPAGQAWSVTVAPALPAGLDPARWEIRPVAHTVNGRWSEGAPASLQITQGSQIVLYYQLVDKG